jgi:hypothetical protein
VGSQTLSLDTNGANVALNSKVSNNQTINANLVLGSTSGPAFSFNNNSMASGALLTVAGNVSGAATSSTVNMDIGSTAASRPAGHRSIRVMLPSIKTPRLPRLWAVKLTFLPPTGGGGMVKLTAANGYTGGTTVTNGFLLADNGSNSTGAGAVVVNSGGELGGTGKIATTGVTTANAVAVGIQSGGPLSPSNSAVGFSHLTLGLAANTTATLESGARLSFNLGANTAASDEVLVTGGKLALNNRQFSDFTFNALSGITTGTYTLIDSSAVGTTGTLGPLVTGSLDGGLFTGTLSLSGGVLLLNITNAAFPEPGTWAMMLGGFCVLIVLQRTRRRNS